MELGRLQGPDGGHHRAFLTIDPQDVLALSKITGWPLGDIETLSAPDFHFWLSEAAVFQDALNRAATPEG